MTPRIFAQSLRTTLLAIALALVTLLSCFGATGCSSAHTQVPSSQLPDDALPTPVSELESTEQAKEQYGIARWLVSDFRDLDATLTGVDKDGKPAIVLGISYAQGNTPVYRIVDCEPALLEELARSVEAAPPEATPDAPGGWFFIDSIAKTVVALIVPVTLRELAPSYVDNFDLADSLQHADTSRETRSAEELRKSLMCQVLFAQAAYDSENSVGSFCGVDYRRDASNGVAKVWSAERPLSRTLVIAIKGTDGMTDALFDLRAATHEIGIHQASMGFPAVSLGDGSLVGEGWTWRWKQLDGQVSRTYDAMKAASQRDGKVLEIVLVGHSLGAVTAQLGAIAIDEDLRSSTRPMRFHVRATTFNSPTLGNRELRKLYQERLMEECPRVASTGKSCLSLHQFERQSDLVHDVPLDDVHPVWQTDNNDDTMGSGPHGGRVGGDKSMYWGTTSLITFSTAVPDAVAAHKMQYWRHDAAVMSDDTLRRMKQL